jgi:hypothetical protein
VGDSAFGRQMWLTTVDFDGASVAVRQPSATLD